MFTARGRTIAGNSSASNGAKSWFGGWDWGRAIALYNDTVATGDNDRLAITNQALRELSGVNGLVLGDWIKAHADEVITHNSKYGMQNAKDSTKVETYYNKRHGAYKITKILNLINERFLDGEALKSQSKG